MAFGTTSSIGKLQPVNYIPKVYSSPQSREQRPRRGKVAPLWEAWKRYSSTLHLTSSQSHFADVFFHGDNCLLSGEAGSGKSYLVKALVDFLRQHRVNVAVTGSTGVASFNIGGQTLHSFAGLGLADEPTDQLIASVRKKGKVKERIRATHVLFLDEVSMIKGELLDKVNAVFRAIRFNNEPFGGCQVVFIGDWLQLAPVFKGQEMQELAFESLSWRAADIQTVVLKEQMRQQSDKVLLSVLNDIRTGNTSSLRLLDARIDAAFPQDGIEPVRIFCKNVDVDGHNKERLRMLSTPAKVFQASDTGSDYHLASLDKNCPAPKWLELKIGAQVMCLANQDVGMGVCNGSIGIVKEFVNGGVKVKFPKITTIITHNEWSMRDQEVGVDGKMMAKVKATRSQIPLKVCYAVTVHKVQGTTLDRAIVDMAEAFAAGQAYCALSRVRDLESLSIVGSIPKSAIKVDPRCIEFYKGC